MSENSFILSICIPTFERSSLLKETLESIVTDPVFQETDKVEIVISDNFSKDDTREVCRKFTELYPGKIKYVSLSSLQNGHINFQNALESSSGLFRKLHNDNYPFEKGALSFLVGFIEKYREKELVLCPNHPPAGREKEEDFFEEINDLSTLVSCVSYTITWIGAICIRKDAYNRLPDPFRYSHLYFPHIDYTLRTIYHGGKGVMTGRHLFRPAPLIPCKYTHNHAEVFAQNYLGILKEYVENSTLSRQVFEHEKRVILFEHVIPYYFDFFRQYNATPQTRYLYYTREYRKNMYYYFSFLYIAFYFTSVRIFKLNRLKNFLLSLFKRA